MTPSRPQQSAFSLVELSIVLVILGLLTGGILAGQSLIRAAELRAVSTEYSRYVTATQTFRDKYFAVPGDFRDATRFWGRAASVGDCVTNSTSPETSISAGTCDGDGNGMIADASGGGQYGEMFLYWQHLARAGLIEGTYTGQAGAANGIETIPATNAPRSKVSNGGWGLRYTVVTSSSSTYIFNYGNMLAVGARMASHMPISSLFVPEEAWNIDTKLDDGLPGQGRQMIRSAGGAWGAATSCTTSSSASDYSGVYRLNNKSPAFALYFPRVF